ncbi:MAG: glycoside hydrolase family 3 N-terminal domain-containing protein [Candidatus Izemoplasmatales bacterium]|nr:glycoside hydrolase family 3 N-terminal domain-containing protein [Candidatus Izemoplasmatales bacterium]
MNKAIKKEEILNNMTLKEKIGQMTQVAPYFFISDSEATVYGALRNLNINKEQVYTIGSILGIGGPSEMIKLQESYLKNATHELPLMFMADVIHGYKTIFPVPLALASSFNPEMARIAGKISAKEAYSSGIHVVFSPMCDLSRDPRWGRVVEGFGEDVFLTGEMAKAMVEGFTNKGKLGKDAVACCIKHFAGYGASEAGRDYNTVDLSRLSLYRDYLPAYKKALEGGADFVMTSFNTLDGVPATINTFLLRKILKEKWQSKAIVISDYDSLTQIIDHGAAENQKEAALKGIKAGLDIEMASSVYMNHLTELIEEGTVKESEIDEIVGKIIDFKIKIGLFDNPYSGANQASESEICLSEEHMDLAKEAALESVVLLENNGVLPLKKKQSIALIGPFAKSRKLIGPWSWHGRNDLHKTLEETLKDNLVFVSEKASYGEYTDEEIKQIKEADVLIMALGEDESLSGEAHSRSNIHLPNDQEGFYQNFRKIIDKVVVLVFGGRPLILSEFKDVDAMMMCWFLGSSSSEAIKELLYGEANPSGKLPMSFPRNIGQIPIYYNHFNTGRPFDPASKNMYLSKYLDVANTPLYPFGYGLSYSNFTYENLSISKDSLKANETLKVSVKVKNDSDLSGKEVIQLYIRDYVAEIVRPVKELKKIRKIHFLPQETKIIDFELNYDDLAYFDHEGKLKLESGKIGIFVGGSSDKTLNKDFYFIK